MSPLADFGKCNLLRLQTVCTRLSFLISRGPGDDSNGIFVKYSICVHDLLKFGYMC